MYLFCGFDALRAKYGRLSGIVSASVLTLLGLAFPATAADEMKVEVTFGREFPETYSGQVELSGGAFDGYIQRGGWSRHLKGQISGDHIVVSGDGISAEGTLVRGHFHSEFREYTYGLSRVATIDIQIPSLEATTLDMHNQETLDKFSDNSTPPQVNEIHPRNVPALSAGANTATSTAGANSNGTSKQTQTMAALPQEPPLDRNQRARIQRQLYLLGLYSANIDGEFGGETRKAIKAFQREYHLQVTGYIDQAMITGLAAKAAVREQELAAHKRATEDRAAGENVAPAVASTRIVPQDAATIAQPAAGGETATSMPQQTTTGAAVPAQTQPPAAPAESSTKEFATATASLQPIDDVYVAVRSAKVRAAPDVTANASETLGVGDRIQVLGRLPGQEWYLVARNGSPIGYVIMSQLVSEVEYEKTQAPVTAVAGATLPVQQTPKLSPELAALDYGHYYALVIGNGTYQSLPKLQTAVDDAKAVAALLEHDYGFTVSLVTDGSEKTVIGELARMRRVLTSEDNLLIYYAGHGWYDDGAERGYWFPVDASEDDQSHWISNADITDMLKAMQAKHVLVVADSCYSGSLTRGLAISTSSEHIADMVDRRARTVLTSGGLEPVLDAGGGGHSVFAMAFLEALHANNGVVDGESIFHQVHDRVRINAEQEPEYGNIRLAGDNGGDFLFVRKQ